MLCQLSCASGRQPVRQVVNLCVRSVRVCDISKLSISKLQRNYKERNVQSKKPQVIRSVIRQHSSVFRQHSSVIHHGRHVVSQRPKQRYFPPVLVTHFLYFGGGATSSV